MDKVFDHKLVESKWTERWEHEGHYKPVHGTSAYCIMIPPPNVTGSLHMGHAFQDTIMDALIRYHRMRGYQTLWQVGTDHAGIATQMVVERQLQQIGTSRHDLGREEFVKKIWEWKDVSGGTIAQQLRRLGASADWTRERFTMDSGLSAAVLKAFVDLYREGLIYRGQRLVNWDPVLHTAISDLEVQSLEETGSMWHIRYDLVDGTGSLVVATTRPETMLGDVAVAVSPTDQRYAHLVGKLLKLPLTERVIPIIADEYVDPEFGTGCVKITPAHDFNDYQVGVRHGLEKINIFTPDAKLNDNAPEKYRGLDRFVAREQIVNDLQVLGALEKIEPHTLKVPRGDRTNAVVEPYLTDQWFIKMDGLAKPAIEAVANGKIKFVPENWTKTYFEWLNNIQDWCISRQLWWGHRIPAWYDAQGNIYVGHDEAETRKHYGLADTLELTQDTDVLDTWFSSALWPFSTLGWPENTKEMQDYYPTNVLVTGFDIIFFWVARMVMFGLKFTGDVPFREVYIHGLIQDQNGQKMSKTKGNVIDPLDLIDGISLDALVAKRTSGLMQPQMAQNIAQQTRKQFPDGIPAHGTDALRFTFCALATNGRHIRFDLQRLEGYKNFCNKLWNAARYVLMNINAENISQDFILAKQYATLNPVDKWIIAKWQECKEYIQKQYVAYRFDFIASALYEFIWNEFCDWYLELSKPMLQSSDANKALSTRNTLNYMLREILQVLHPLTPFITEEIWQYVTNGAEGLLINHAYPQVENICDEEALASVQLVREMVIAVRNIRGEMNIAPSKHIKLIIAQANAQQQAIITAQVDLIKALARVSDIDWLKAGDESPVAAVALVADMELHIPMHGLIDKQSEQMRQEKEVEKIKKELEKVSQKLANQSYVQKAPAEVVAKERGLLIELEKSLERLQQSLQVIARL